MKKNAFRDQVVIVTGASSGIGRSLALILASQGAKVVLAARRTVLLEQAATECRSLGGEAMVIQTDVADEAQCKAMIDKTIDRFGRLDMLVNNAGLAIIARLEDFSDLRLFRHTMDVNFYGAVYCTYHALSHLMQSRGRIVAISSLGGKAPLPYNSQYVASKFAMHGFFDSLRMELAGHGVSVTIICPSWVVTGFHEAQLNKDGIPKGPQGRAIYSKKMMTAERCAEITLQAANKRRREVLMGPGVLAVLIRTLAPGLLDKLTVKIFLEPAIKRAKAGKVEV
jgi:short-subunit dehydrogenase